MITDRIYEWARTQPDKTALIHNDHPCSYAVFARAIEVTKTFLTDQDLPAGGTAIVRISNLADAWIVVLALRSIGLTTICVNSLATAKALNIKDVACIVMAEADKTAHQLEEQIRLGTQVVVVPRAIYANIPTGDIPRPSSDTSPFGGHILYTSGTTGLYKKVLADGSDEDKRNAFWATSISFDRGTVSHLASLAPWTVSGFIRPPAVWHVGGCVVIDQFPETSSRSFRGGITHAVLTTSLLQSFLEVPHLSADSAGDFQLSVVGGFLPLALAKRAVDQVTKNVSVVYGATEHTSRMQSLFKTEEDLQWLSPNPDSSFEIADENDNDCPIGKEGELRIRLRDIDATSYLDDEDASRKFFREGCFYSGDLAVRRADGRIRVLGRVADVLSVQGQKIAVAPTEQKIQRFLGSSAVCLFSWLNDKGIEELAVAIEADKAPTKSQLDHIAHEFRAFGRVRFEVLDKFPRTEGGMQKIKRLELRRLIAG